MFHLAALLLSVTMQGSACGAIPSSPPTARPSPIVNSDVVFKFMREHYPADLRTDSVAPQPAMLWLCVDTLGKVTDQKLVAGTGAAALDTLALQVIKLSQFEASVVDGKKQAAWVAYPLQLSPTASTVKLTTKELSKQPVYTPFTVAPELTNRQQVAEEMTTNYPPRMKSSRIGGVVTLWVFVDEKGNVKNTAVKQGSGYKELDDFAQGIGSIMRFTPALYKDAKVPVWITLPLRLRAN